MHSELYPTRRRHSPSSKDVAGQLFEIRSFLSKFMAVEQELELPNAEAFRAGKTAVAVRQLYDPKDLSERLAWAKRLAGDTKDVVIGHLKLAQSLGHMRRVAMIPDVGALDALERDFPHLADVVSQVRRRVALASMSTSPVLRLPPLLLGGPPGTGKTAFAQRLAGLLKAKILNIDMANIQTAFTITGLDVGYATGKAGLIWEALQGESMAPVVILDELDKAEKTSGERDVTAFLYGLLEPVTSGRFIDGAIGLAIDASRVIWIATCNDADAIHPAILSRFTQVDVDYPSPQQMPSVIRSIQEELLRDAEWKDGFSHDLDEAVVEALACLQPRQVWQALEDAYSSAALAGRRTLLPCDIPEAKRHAPSHRSIGFIHSFNAKAAS